MYTVVTSGEARRLPNMLGDIANFKKTAAEQKKKKEEVEMQHFHFGMAWDKETKKLHFWAWQKTIELFCFALISLPVFFLRSKLIKVGVFKLGSYTTALCSTKVFRIAYNSHVIDKIVTNMI